MTERSKVQPWEVIESTMALDERWFPVRRDKVRLPSGKVVDDFFIWEAPHIVTVVPLTEDNRFVLCHQYRHGIQQVTWQFPAGAMDKGEEPLDAAKRELLEETGYGDGVMSHLGHISPYGHKMTDLEDMYLAMGVEPIQEPVDDEYEPTEVGLFTVAELMVMVETNQIVVASSLCGVFLALRRLRWM